MQPLLEAAPWGFPVRGNHEDCNRAWEGWFRFLDRRPFQTACQHYTDPYSVAVGALQLLVFDSAETNDTAVTPELAQTYTAKFDIVRQLAGPNAWLLHHHPLWGVNAATEVNVTMQAAANNTLPEGVKLDLAGHVHSFQALSFSPARSPQMVVGNGGDNLVQFGSRPIVGVTIAGGSVSNAHCVQPLWLHHLRAVRDRLDSHATGRKRPARDGVQRRAHRD
jgi:hypothetical protein